MFTNYLALNLGLNPVSVSMGLTSGDMYGP